MKTVRRPPYPKWNPGYFPCSSLTPLPLSSRPPSVSFGGFGVRRRSGTVHGPVAVADHGGGSVDGRGPGRPVSSATGALDGGLGDSLPSAKPGPKASNEPRKGAAPGLGRGTLKGTGWWMSVKDRNDTDSHLQTASYVFSPQLGLWYTAGYESGSSFKECRDELPRLRNHRRPCGQRLHGDEDRAD